MVGLDAIILITILQWLECKVNRHISVFLRADKVNDRFKMSLTVEPGRGIESLLRPETAQESTITDDNDNNDGGNDGAQ